MKEHPRHPNGDLCHCGQNCSQCSMADGKHCASCHQEQQHEKKESEVPIVITRMLTDRLPEHRYDGDEKDKGGRKDSPGIAIAVPPGYSNLMRDFLLGLIFATLFGIAIILIVFLSQIGDALGRNQDAALEAKVDETVGERIGASYTAHRDELRGPIGPEGVPGVQGQKGVDGVPGVQGPQGDPGIVTPEMVREAVKQVLTENHGIIPQEKLEESIMYLVTTGILKMPEGKEGREGPAGPKGDPAPRLNLGEFFAQLRAQCDFIDIGPVYHSGALLVLCGTDGIVIPKYGQPMTIMEAVGEQFFNMNNTPSDVLARIRQIYLQQHP